MWCPMANKIYRMDTRNTDNMEMRTFHCELAHRVQTEHRSRCPCCLKPMVRAKNKRGVADPRRDVRTVGHDKAIGFGGDIRSWVFICAACNKDQGARTFRAWSRALAQAGDTRATAVAALADTFDQHYRSSDDGRYIAAAAAE